MIRTAQYWPSVYNPLRQGALVEALDQDGDWYLIKFYDNLTRWVPAGDLEVLVRDEEDDND